MVDAAIFDFDVLGIADLFPQDQVLGLFYNVLEPWMASKQFHNALHCSICFSQLLLEFFILFLQEFILDHICVLSVSSRLHGVLSLLGC